MTRSFFIGGEREFLYAYMRICVCVRVRVCDVMCLMQIK